jgi:hypothetical protein
LLNPICASAITFAIVLSVLTVVVLLMGGAAAAPVIPGQADLYFGHVAYAQETPGRPAHDQFRQALIRHGYGGPVRFLREWHARRGHRGLSLPHCRRGTGQDRRGRAPDRRRGPPYSAMLRPQGFILPCQPTSWAKPPLGLGWGAESSTTAFRVIARKERGLVNFASTMRRALS